MRILLSNDDGYFSPGLAALYQSLCDLGEVVVVAPEQNRSGASNSLTLDRPLILRRARNGFYYVNGTPTDCVHLAVSGLLENLPDIVVSGINQGENMGDDTIYSGTVAAAMEGYLLGIPSFAVSLAWTENPDFSAAGKIARDVVARFIACPFAEPVLLNINVPALPLDEIKGLRLTRLGRRHKAEPVIKAISPRHEAVYWLGAAGDAADAGEGTDFHALKEGYASLTPLQADLTHTAQMARLQGWMD